MEEARRCPTTAALSVNQSGPGKLSRLERQGSSQAHRRRQSDGQGRKVEVITGTGNSSTRTLDVGGRQVRFEKAIIARHQAVKLPFLPQIAHHRFHRALELRSVPSAYWSSAAASSAWNAPCTRRWRPGRRGRDARRTHARDHRDLVQAWQKKKHAAIRSRDAQDEKQPRQRRERTHPRRFRGRRAAVYGHGAGLGRPQSNGRSSARRTRACRWTSRNSSGPTSRCAPRAAHLRLATSQSTHVATSQMRATSRRGCGGAQGVLRATLHSVRRIHRPEMPGRARRKRR